MKRYILAAGCALAAIVTQCWMGRSWLRKGEVCFANSLGSGTHTNACTLQADATISTFYLLVKQGTDALHFAVNADAHTLPIGVCSDSPTAGDFAAINYLGAANETRRMVASAAISKDAPIFTAAGGKIQPEPTVAGTYWFLGYARDTAAADGDEIEVETVVPIKLVVVAAMTSTNGTAAGAADLDALKTEAEKIGDDVRAIAAALATPALVKVLAA